MTSRADKMLQMCYDMLDKESIAGVFFAQLLIEDPSMGVLVTYDDEVHILRTRPATDSDHFGLGPRSQFSSPVKRREIERVDELCKRKIRYFAAGKDHILALTQCGLVYACGKNGSGQLGNDSKKNSSVPVAVAGDLQRRVVTQVECGNYFSVALAGDGKVFTWGYNLCTGHGTDSGFTLSPRVVEGLLTDRIIVKVSSNSLSVLCLTREGEVYSFGHGGRGNLGIGNTADQHSPVRTQIPAGHKVTDISSGIEHTLALTSDGVVFAWGANGYGQGGTRIREKLTTPTEIYFNFNDRVTNIMAEGETSFAMTVRRVVCVWGKVNGQVFVEPVELDITFPEPIVKIPSIDSVHGNNNLKCDYLKAFDNDEMSNFIISVEGKDLHVHSHILQIRSPYFAAMFQNEWKETATGRHVVVDQPYDVYREFLRYLYCGEVGDLDIKQYVQLLGLAKMALDNPLYELCSNVVRRRLAIDNVMDVFSQAVTIQLDELVTACVNFATDGIQQIIDSDAFRQIPAEHIRDFFIRFSNRHAISCERMQE